jgi:polyketide synthase 12
MRDSSAMAVVGMSCRLPGASDTAGFWRLLQAGSSQISEIPPNRQTTDGSVLATLSPGARYGAFLEQIDRFDCSFFGIAPKEAAAMDPQQRLMLELCWEALEDAHVIPSSLAGTQTGVFVGAIAGDYGDLLRELEPSALTRHAATGSLRSMIANRVSHTLGLCGPSLTVDTGQSSSLVAVHLACESLRRGESTLALACGVHLNISAASLLQASSFGGLSPDGCCFAFDARANGYVRGEGGGVVLLKRLSDALEAGDSIYCVIHSSAVNNDGNDGTLTAPSKSAQEEVLRLAYRRGGVKRSQVQYVELHGTGTVLGDRVEAAALGAVLGSARPAGRPLPVGSVKTNLGHLEGAAGIAGLLKTALCIKYGEIPASLNFQRPPADIPLQQLRLRVQQELQVWPSTESGRLAGVSSFGLGGTNCHVVMGEPCVQEPNAPKLRSQALVEVVPVDPLGEGALAWTLSGRGEAALSAQAERLGEHLRLEEELDAVDVGYSLAVGRAAFENRAVVIGATREELLVGLGALAGEEPAESVVEGIATDASASGGVVFLFPGQGSQWVGMARALLDCSPVFVERVRECEEALAPVVDWRLEHVLRGLDGSPALDRIDVLQPALFAVMVSLAQLWRVCGVSPAVVLGHSQGEIAAACVAGGLSLEDAARVVALRSRMQAAHEGHGGMMSVAAPQARVRELLERWGGRIVVAAMNGPRSLVLAGESGPMAELVDVCAAEGINARMIKAARGASHSPQVEPLREELLEALSAIAPREGSVAFCSTVTGGLFDTSKLGAEYWYRNMREPVQFEPAVRGLLERGHRAFIEISTHPVLAVAVQETIDELAGEEGNLARESVVVGTLRRDQGDRRRFLHSLAEAWVAGVSVDWTPITQRAGVQRVTLPTYAFQRKRHWLASGAGPRQAVQARGDRTEAPASTDFDAVRDDHGDPFAEADLITVKDDYLDASTLTTRSRLGRRLVAASRAERERIVLEIVRAQVAVVLGHDSLDAVRASQPFKELGFDSQAVVDLRNRLRSATGLRLPTAVLFDSPTPHALALGILRELAGADTDAPAPTSLGLAREPLAIIGMACRYPGGACSPEELWRLVASGGDAISGFPTDRGWDMGALHSPDPDRRGTSYAREGGFLYEAGEFDAAFFGISPREALAMDPQQRILLETCWEAVERAGIDQRSLKSSETGVFAGVSSSDYGFGLGGDPQGGDAAVGAEGYRLTGRAASVISGRVAYALGLEGPAITVDTACSSSLVAMHLACQALLAGECSLALAGGVTVMSSPEAFVEFSRQRGLAPDGRCKSFADAADGTGWAEGVGVLMLERLSDARRKGHRVLATVRGSAVNQDGASNSLTAPSGSSQQRVILRTLASARLSPAQVDAVEAHGTGTRLGDPIEADALLSTYGLGRSAERPLWLGSIKSNIGHTQAAAGVAGVIKMVMAMRHGVLPRTLHVDQPSREVDWSSGTVALLTEPQRWERNGDPRRAGVSSFGISGTNAHVILEEAPVSVGGAGVGGAVELGPLDIGVNREMITDSLGCDSAGEAGVPVLGVGVLAGVTPWVVSGRGELALRDQARRLQRYVVDAPDVGVTDVGLSLTGRAALENRTVLLGGDRRELLVNLESVACGEAGEGVTSGAATESEEVVFLFPGQGSQWEGMALELLEYSPLFARRLRECGDALAPFVDWSLLDVLRGVRGAPGLDRVDVVQPVLFATMVSLAALWRACGVVPDVVLGHSQGEIAAVCVAGGLSLDDAARVVAFRARALRRLAGLGGMMSVALSPEELGPRLELWGERISLAAVNGPRSMVLSGDPRAIEGLFSECEAEGVRARMIPVDYAAHSAQVEAVRAELLEACARIVPCSGEIPFRSTVTGELLDTAELDGEYWYRNLRETVQFEQAVRASLDGKRPAFIEVSPHPVLTVGVQETVDALPESSRDIVIAGSLRRGEGGPKRFVRSLSEVFVRGVGVEWGALFEGSGARRVELPTYAFQRERFWPEPIARGAGDLSAVGLGSTAHPLLGAALALADGGWLFAGRISLRSHSWLADHVVAGSVLFPGTAFLELALRAGSAVECGRVCELTLQAPLVLVDDEGARLQLRVGEPDEAGCRSVGMYSCREDAIDGGSAGETTWTCHAEGVLGPDLTTSDRHRAVWAQEWPPVGSETIDVDELYERQAGFGFVYGPAFQGLSGAWRLGDELFAEVVLPDEQQNEITDFILHPALLDAALHAMSGCNLPAGDKGEGIGNLPFSWKDVAVARIGVPSVRVRFARSEADGVSVSLADERGAPVAVVGSLVTRAMTSQQLADARGGSGQSLFGLDWVTVPVVPSHAAGAGWAALEGDGSLDELIAGVAESETVGGAPEVYADMAHLSKALDDGASAPEFVFVEATLHLDAGARELTEVAHERTGGVLELIQAWVAERRLERCRLVVITQSAVATCPEEDVCDLAGTPTWGLVRCAQAEYPGSLTLVDVDGERVSRGVLAAALDLHEPQVAIRQGAVLVPRLLPLGSDAQSCATQSSPGRLAAEDGDAALGPDCTVLVTGGTGRLGSLIARHLVVEHGVRNLLLTSRSGSRAPGAEQLLSELAALGAGVRIVACDVSDREQVRALLESVDRGYPLRAVVHAASTIDDGTIGSLTRGHLDRVLASKLDAAWYLHELTRETSLRLFVLLSSAAGVLGQVGQGSYAAANAFLDGLAAHRCAQGLPALSLALGPWEQDAARTNNLNRVDLARLARFGIRALSPKEGLGLIDAALRADRALVAPVRLALADLRVRARAGELPVLFRGLVRVPAQALSPGTDPVLVRRLVGSSDAERLRVTLQFVRAEAATVLGHGAAVSIDARRAFKEMGFDSLAAVELRNRLVVGTGLSLPVALLFEQPTPQLLAEHILDQLERPERITATTVKEELERLESMLGLVPDDDIERLEVSARLQLFFTGLREQGYLRGDLLDDEFASVGDEEIFDLIDQELS